MFSDQNDSIEIQWLNVKCYLLKIRILLDSISGQFFSRVNFLRHTDVENNSTDTFAKMENAVLKNKTELNFKINVFVKVGAKIGLLLRFEIRSW